MKITKLGHSCLLVEEKSARILIDPGEFSNGQNELTNLDAILITHEHPDHCSLDSLFIILGKNPQAIVYTNNGTAEIFKKAGIPYRTLNHGQSTMVKNVIVEAFGADHNVVYLTISIVSNSGFLIGEKLFHPGDSYTIPPKPVEILALPTGGPWLKSSEAVDFAKHIKPKTAFPIHDGMFKIMTPAHFLPKKILPEAGIEWISLLEGESRNF